MGDQPERDEVLMRVLELAMMQPADERDAYLETVCSDDPQLLAQARNYVTWEERMNGFLLEPLCRPLAIEHPFAAAELVDDRFRILREIAQGGMGVVYEAFDERLQHRIAIKVAKMGFHNWLPSEVRHAQEITHPNICKIYQLHTAHTPQGDLDFITMEYLDGPTLKERLRDGKPDKGEANLIVEQVCAGLAEAHRRGVIHGDLKNTNVMLTRDLTGDLRAVITDFGLARGKYNNRRTGRSAEDAGTPAYMAPELWRGEDATVASDIYALGVLLSEVLLGIRPKGGTASWKTASSKEAPPVLNLRRSALARCVDPDPSARFASADAVWEALDPSRARRRFLIGGITAVAAGLVWRVSTFTPNLPDSPIASVAVIPFENSGGAENQFLAEGISEEVINALAQLPDLKVVARSSSFKYAAASLNIRKTASVLGVKALVVGRLASLEKQLRVTTEIVSGSDGSRLWGAQYSRPLAELPGMQAQISQDIAEKIRTTLTPAQQERLSTWANVNPAAYERLLRGRYQRRLYRTDSRVKALELFEQALGIDPGFALASGELALTYRYLSAGGVLDPDKALPIAEANARRALALRPTLPEAHLALAEIRKDQWDWGPAEQEYRQTLALSPSLVEPHQGFAIFLSQRGKFDEAVAEIRRAIELDPVGLPTAITAIGVFYNVDRFDDALKEVDRAEMLDPTGPVPWSWRGMIYGAIGRFMEALPAYEKAIALGDDTGVIQCFYAYSLARAGQKPQAVEIMQRLRRSQQFVPPSAYALIYLGLGQKEQALQSLEAAFMQRDSMLQYLKVEAHFDALQDHPRYQALAAKIGLP